MSKTSIFHEKRKKSAINHKKSPFSWIDFFFLQFPLSGCGNFFSPFLWMLRRGPRDTHQWSALTVSTEWPTLPSARGEPEEEEDEEEEKGEEEEEEETVCLRLLLLFGVSLTSRAHFFLLRFSFIAYRFLVSRSLDRLASRGSIFDKLESHTNPHDFLCFTSLELLSRTHQ